MWDKIVYLRKIKAGELDSKNRPVKRYEETEAYCNLKDIGITEFYQARIAGYKPNLKIEIKREAWNALYTHLKYEDDIYKILRTQLAKNENLTLVCEALVGDTGG